MLETRIFMMERPPEPKKGEHCPLLKVDIGRHDSVRQPAAVPQNWSVSCLSKKSCSWVQKWPGTKCINPLTRYLVAASWMTLILFFLSFLLIYALGMATYARQPLLVKQSNGKPVSNVFLHQIINKGDRLPLELYQHFLELMGHTYPNLRFNVFFLIDDASRHPYYIPRHGRLPGRWLTYPNKDVYVKHSCVKEFEKRYSNVNITIMALNKYMAMTPLRFKWRTIPRPYLTFYARVFSVWQNAAIAMDIMTYEDILGSGFQIDRRVNEILKNQNDGLPESDYNVLLQAIDEEDDKSFKCLRQILNDTLSMFNHFFSLGSISPTEVLPSNDTPIVRTQRSRRDSSYNFYDLATSENTLSTAGNMLTDTSLNATINVSTNNSKENSSKNDLLENEIPQTTTASANLTSSEEMPEDEKVPEINLVPVQKNKSDNISERQQAVLLYDFSIMSDRLGSLLLREPVWPTFIFSGSFSKTEASKDVAKKNITKPVAQLALSSDGLFVASSCRMHQFLGMLMTAPSQRMHPEFVIQETLQTQCPEANATQRYYCNIYHI